MNQDQNRHRPMNVPTPKTEKEKVTEVVEPEVVNQTEEALAESVEELKVGADDVTPESNLITHAKRELALIGEEPETVEGYLKVIQAFSEMGHSGGSAAVAISTLHRLLQYKNLSEITDNPDEWTEVGPNLWQSVRSSNLFSEDGGESYTDIDDRRDVKQRHGSAHYDPKAI